MNQRPDYLELYREIERYKKAGASKKIAVEKIEGIYNVKIKEVAR